jgi:hypothetical protein
MYVVRWKELDLKHSGEMQTGFICPKKRDQTHAVVNTVLNCRVP